MIEYENIKKCYIGTIQIGLNMGFPNPKQGNEFLHKFCENLIDSDNCSEAEKQHKKQDLALVKETLSHEIDDYLRGTKL